MATRREMMFNDLEGILMRARIRAESGRPWEDFVNRKNDSDDFATISRAGLYEMLNAAYRAGAKHAHTYGGSAAGVDATFAPWPHLDAAGNETVR